jgi:hypothetical protein
MYEGNRPRQRMECNDLFLLAADSLGESRPLARCARARPDVDRGPERSIALAACSGVLVPAALKELIHRHANPTRNDAPPLRYVR